MGLLTEQGDRLVTETGEPFALETDTEDAPPRAAERDMGRVTGGKATKVQARPRIRSMLPGVTARRGSRRR